MIVMLTMMAGGPVAAGEEAPAADIGPPAPAAGEAMDVTTDGAGDDELSLADQRAAGQAHLAQLNDEQRYDEAAAVALQILRLTQEEFGEDAPQVITPLLDLAEAQRKNADLSVAEQNLSSAVQLIEKYTGPLSAELIEPLVKLGKIYNESGLYDKASQAFDRALRLNHINQGFKNPEQLAIMDGLTDSYIFLNDIEEATFYQEEQLEIEQRRLGVDSPETAPAYFKLARWYGRINRYEDAIVTYQKADRVVRQALGKDSPERTEGLMGLALIYQQIGNRTASNSLLRKALQLNEQSPDDNSLRRASILVALGDSLTREGRFSTAQEQYSAAWQALPDDEIGNDLRENYFGKPIRLEGNLFPRYARRARGQAADKLKKGSVLINFSLDEKGRVRNPSVVESYPQGLMDKSFLSIYRRSLFRPLYVDGVATSHDDLLVRHEFWYVANDTASDQDSAEDKNDDSGAIAKPPENRGRLEYPDGD